jgi:hypothetical protein
MGDMHGCAGAQEIRVAADARGLARRGLDGESIEQRGDAGAGVARGRRHMGKGIDDVPVGSRHHHQILRLADGAQAPTTAATTGASYARRGDALVPARRILSESRQG